MDPTMDKPSLYQQFCNYMERETNGVEIGVYTVSGLLFAIAYHKVRPITKFVKPSQIPQHFIKNKLKQNGIVSGIEPSIKSGPLLSVNHKPPVNLFFASRKTLPVKVAGIDVNANGFAWLQSVVVDHKVNFVPLFKHSDNAECLVFLMPPLKDKSNHKSLDIAEALLSLGFAQTNGIPPEIPVEDKKLIRYYKFLAHVEKKAKDKRLGVWSMKIPPPVWPVRKFQETLDKLILAITPVSRRLPELVR